MSETDLPSPRKRLRLWPGVIAAIAVCVARYVVPFIDSDFFLFGFIAALVGAVVILFWWVFFSRAAWSERLGAVAVTVAAVFATKPFLHPSIATGMMGMMFVVYALPAVVAPALVAWAVLTRRLSDPVRRVTLVLTIVVACAVWTLLRTDGILGGARSQIAWRWTKTAEERLLAHADDETIAPARTGSTGVPLSSVPSEPPSVKTEENAPEPTVTPAPATAPTAAARAIWRKPEWPGFRGPGRDGVIRSVRIDTDWAQSPPVQVWRRAVGPGWSSFAIRGDLVYTQEQRGDSEVVSCYRLSTGQPVWRHGDRVRFWESNGGPGPRGTPTLSGGLVYAFGATGVLNALNAETGSVVWTHNVSSDAGKSVPMWGFASSPLLVDDLVVVAASGKLIAYEAATGVKRWSGPSRPGSYSSPQLFAADGVAQILLLDGAGVTSVAVADGRSLWDHAWPGGTPIVQPAVIDNGDILINAISGTGGLGLRRIAVTHSAGRWKTEERWTSTGLKPYFNDFVVHKGHAFGFDGSILSCIDLTDGSRKWKGGRYGSGQLVLLPEQDLLLVVSEEGELALVNATPDQFTEVGRFKAIEGKTWNHPVLVHDILLVRNGEEMAAFRLSIVRP